MQEILRVQTQRFFTLQVLIGVTVSLSGKEEERWLDLNDPATPTLPLALAAAEPYAVTGHEVRIVEHEADYAMHTQRYHEVVVIEGDEPFDVSVAIDPLSAMAHYKDVSLRVEEETECLSPNAVLVVQVESRAYPQV